LLSKLNIKSDFIKNSATLIGGTVIAQAIPILLQPVLRRMYTPEEYGALAIYLNLFGIITIVSSLRYEAAIMLPKQHNQAANVLGLSFVINLIINGIIFLVLLAGLKPISNALGLNEKYASYLLLLPISGLAFGIYQNINYWLIRQKAFAASTKNKITRRIIEGISQILSGILKLKGGLFWGDLLGNLANVISGVKQMFKNNFNKDVITKKRLGWALKKYKEFPLYNALPTLASSIATTLPYLFINKFYSTETVAHVDLCRLALSVPLVFVSSTLSQILFQDITERKAHKKPVYEELKKVLLIVLAVFIAEIIVVELIAPQLFSFVFGEPYRISGDYAKWLVLSFGFSFITSTFSFLLITFQKLKLNAIWQIAYLAGISSLYWFGHLPLKNFIQLFIGIDVAFQIILILIFIYTVKQYQNKI
jgi:O-antigen/teichoic acid export membrane protein